MKIKFLFAAVLLFAVFSGCKKDPCKDINCLHGVCNEGVCICESGWDGEFCTNDADPCRNVTCVNGTCVNGDCDCDPGYEGTDCGTAVNAKFAGGYIVFPENCIPSGSIVAGYQVQIAASVIDPASVIVTGLWENPGASVTATISSNGLSFNIPRQLYGGQTEELDGSGTMSTDGTNIQISYTIYDAVGQTELDACIGTLTKI